MTTDEAIMAVITNAPQTMMEIHAARKIAQGERVFPVKGTLVTMIALDRLRVAGKVNAFNLSDENGRNERLVWVRA